MAERRASVRNAADPEQVGKAKETERFRRERELNDLRAVVGTLEGRRVLWRFLGQTKAFESIFDAGERIYYNSGRQDFGHFIIAEIGEADPEAWLLMQIEANKMEATLIEPEPMKELPNE